MHDRKDCHSIWLDAKIDAIGKSANQGTPDLALDTRE
jgi:hypothetical protein